MTEFCEVRWNLFYSWTRQVGAASRNKPNERYKAYQALTNHQATCKACRAHLAAMSKLSSQAVHPAFEEA